MMMLMMAMTKSLMAMMRMLMRMLMRMTMNDEGSTAETVRSMGTFRVHFHNILMHHDPI